LANIAYLTYNIPWDVYTGLHDDPTDKSLILCKVRFYFSHIFGQMARYFLLLACFDRYWMTKSIHPRNDIQRSIIAKRLVCIISVVWIILGSHQLIFMKISHGQWQIYFILNQIYLIISVSILPPVFMSILAILTYEQIKESRRQIQPKFDQSNVFILRRKDREFLLMIFMKIFLYIFTMLLYFAFSLKTLITFSTKEYSINQSNQTETLIVGLAVFLIYANHVTPFYIYVLVSKHFRTDLKNFFRR
jgi:hypothetical protein